MSRVEYAFLWRKKSQMLEIARGDFMKEKERQCTLLFNLLRFVSTVLTSSYVI